MQACNRSTGSRESGNGGETPEVGDYVKNQYEQSGTVTRVHFAQNEEERINIRWDDGGIDLLFAPAKGFILISRQA